MVNARASLEELKELVLNQLNSTDEALHRLNYDFSNIKIITKNGTGILFDEYSDQFRSGFKEALENVSCEK